jgi:hypothetical protein
MNPNGEHGLDLGESRGEKRKRERKERTMVTG